MIYTYSQHILQRMKERNISIDDINLLFNDVNIVIIPSKQDNDVELILGCVFSKYIVVICNKKTKNLITVRHMRKNEKKYWSIKK